MSTANHRPSSHTMKIRIGMAIATVRIRMAIITVNCLAAYAGVLIDACDKIADGEVFPFHSHGGSSPDLGAIVAFWITRSARRTDEYAVGNGVAGWK